MPPVYPIYSSLFSTLYDEQHQIGHFGGGTHYSVFRSVEWLDVVRNPLPNCQIHDFAVIWDDDHDTRIISAIEQLYVNGLLSPVQFIGEHKGTLTIIVAAIFYWHGKEYVLHEYEKLVRNISGNLGFDSWYAEVGSFDRSSGSPQNIILKDIIGDTEDLVYTYLRNIDILWNLGTKDYKGGALQVVVPPPLFHK